MSHPPQECLRVCLCDQHPCAHLFQPVLQVIMQTQNSNAKMLRNAAVLQWHKDTREAARLARYAAPYLWRLYIDRQTVTPLMATQLEQTHICITCLLAVTRRT